MKGAGCIGGALGCVLWLLFAPIAAYLTFDISSPSTGTGLGACMGLLSVLFLPIVLSVVLGALTTYVINNAVRARKVPRREREMALAEVQKKQAEAESLTLEMTHLFQKSESVVSSMPGLLANARGWLRQAEQEYNDRAFGPFWDAVENATQNLAAYSNGARQLADDARVYYRWLRGRKHNFPLFPASPDSIPDPGPVMAEFQRVVRMGQRDFQFANIYEHRRTREVLIEGFATLTEALDNLAWVTEASMNELRQSLCSDMARVVEREIATQGVLEDHAQAAHRSAEEQAKLQREQLARLEDIDRRLGEKDG